MITVTSIHDTLVRQVNHWHQASIRLSNLDNHASAYAWYGVDHKLSAILRKTLETSAREVVRIAKKLKLEIENSAEALDTTSYFTKLNQLRVAYLRAEETVHYYTVALNSRTTPGLSALLRACDILCVLSMQKIFNPLGRKTPYVLTYVDKGIGAAILKAGLRLWDGNLSSVAAIKITQHNLYRPTAIIHETGHQMAHVLNWNKELSEALKNGLSRHPKIVGEAFSMWSSEMAADAFAFVHTGFAAVAALHDVVSGSPSSVFAFRRNDPHPISYLRVLLNIEMCNKFYGPGPWDNLGEAFKISYDVQTADYASVKLIKMCLAALPEVVSILLEQSYQAFNNNSLAKMIPPDRVSPESLKILETEAGEALFTSHAWISNECIRLLALVGYKIGLGRGDLPEFYRQQEEWMKKLGYITELN